MIPQGYAAHPNAPGWMYELANPQNVVQEPPDLAPPAPPPPPQQVQWSAVPGRVESAAYAQPDYGQGYAQPQGQAQPTYGTVDTSLVEGEIDSLARYGKGDTLWLDFQQMKTAPAGAEEAMILRFMPPWSMQERQAHFRSTTHELLPGMVPDSKQKYPKVDCFNNEGGPGQCDVCAVCEELLATGQLSEDDTKAVRKMQGSLRIRWQAVREDKPDIHWQQQKDSAGNVMRGPDGQPYWKFVPGIFSAKLKLHKKLLMLMQQEGDFTSPDNGFPIRIAKQKTGSDDFDVEYQCTPTTFEKPVPKSPLAADFRGALDNLIDLRGLLYFRDRTVMQQIAANIRARFQPQHRPQHVQTWQPPAQLPGQQQAWSPPQQARPMAPPVHQQQQAPAYAPPAPPQQAAVPAPPPLVPPAPPSDGPWFPHPQDPTQEYSAAGKMRPRAAAAPPAQPAAPPLPRPAAGGPPPGWGQPPQQVVRPPGPPPAGLPPAAAPGMHQGRPVGPVVPPPPGPGMGSVVSPQQLEQHLQAGQRDDGTPF